MVATPEYTRDILEPGRDAAAIRQWFKERDTRGTVFTIGDPEDPVFDVDQMLQERTTQDSATSTIWTIRKSGEVTGIVWLLLQDTDDLPAPSVHLITTSDASAATVVMKDTIRYAYCNLPYVALWTRSLVSNDVSLHVAKKLGFEKDSEVYDDQNGQKWQNATLVL
jgi:hypothetical protein